MSAVTFLILRLIFNALLWVLIKRGESEENGVAFICSSRESRDHVKSGFRYVC